MALIQKATAIAAAAVGLVLFLLGVLMSQFWADLVEDNFNANLPLRPESQSFLQWRRTPLPLYMKVYFWNWTNAGRVYERGFVPSFEEVGPYVFREVHEKVNVTWNENGTVTFRTIKRWYFEPEMSKGSLGDNVTSVNVVAAAASYITRDLNRLFLYPISLLLRTTDQKISWTKNVSELLFDGFDNSLQKFGTYFSSSTTPDRFGWFYQKNGTLPDDVFNMGTGTDAIADLGDLKYWNYRNTTDFYPGCEEVSGSTGEFWPPDNRKDRPLLMYSADMCRQIRFYFEEETTYGGLSAYVYAGTANTVDNGSRLEENKCYCRGNCLPSGVFDVSACQSGAPVFLSYPHFYGADPFYGKAVTGMNPEREKHRYYLTLEPRSGIQLEVAARMQINVYLKRNPGLSLFKNISDVLMPVLWLDTHVALSDEFVAGLETVAKLLLFGPFAAYGLAAAGALLVTAAAAMRFAPVASLSCVKGKLKKSESRSAATGEEATLYSFDRGERQVKYVLPEPGDRV